MFTFGVATSTTPSDVNVTGSNNYGVSPGKDSESMLDILRGRGSSDVYWGSDTTSSTHWIAVLNAIITDSSRPSVVTPCRDVNAQAMIGSPPDNGVPAYTNPITTRHFPAVNGYPSGAGWDACTGLGTIDGGALLGALQSVYQQDCQFILDRTQNGKDEVSETLSGSGPGCSAGE